MRQQARFTYLMKHIITSCTDKACPQSFKKIKV